MSLEEQLALGIALQQADRHREALECFDTVLCAWPDNLSALMHRGISHQALHQFEPALSDFEHVLTRQPGVAAAHNNCAIVLQILGHYDEARQHYETAVALDPGHREYQKNLGQFLLLQGDYARGWQAYEGRFKRVVPGIPVWDGQAPLAGKRLLVSCEQGYGDTLQFCRYVKPLAALGARVVFGVQTGLLALLHDLDGAEQVISDGTHQIAIDYQMALMSAPAAWQRAQPDQRAAIPVAARYLAADPRKVAAWRTRLPPSQRPRVGLVWSGKPSQDVYWKVDERRNIALARLFPLLACEVDWVSLQRDDPAKQQLTQLQAQDTRWQKVIDFSAAFHDFSDTAALIENLDLVVTVDTAMAHLSAALGVPTWMMNRFDTCWRWLLQRTDSPWYPSLRIFRQPSLGDWDSVIAQVQLALQGFAVHRKV